HTDSTPRLYTQASPLSYTLSPHTEIYTLSLHDALPIWKRAEEILDLVRRTENEITMSDDIVMGDVYIGTGETDGVRLIARAAQRSEEHTSELQSRFDIVCRLLLEKKKSNRTTHRPRRG